MLAFSREDHTEDQLLDIKTFILCKASATDQVNTIWNTVILGTNFSTTKESNEDG